MGWFFYYVPTQTFERSRANLYSLLLWMGIMANREQTVEQLFGAALDRRPEDRRAFLDRACAAAPELKQRVEELLLADERAGSFLERSLPGSPAARPLTPQPTLEANGGSPDHGAVGSAPLSRFEPGQTIAGRFAVVRFIARGGMGEVYEVEDRFLQGVHVALKVILPQIAGDAGSTHRFEQEVLLARKVTHPNLCPIYDISRCGEPPPPFLFLTMKLLSGETLASRLQRSPRLLRSETISIFRQIIAGLAAIHSAGVVHRDVKPTNVMLDQQGPDLCVSIMDFGLARLYASPTTALTLGLIAGTPGYIAPELLRGDPPSQATDIFALGVLFQEVLTADHPPMERHCLSAKPSSALDVADVPPVFIQSVKEFLSDDPARRCLAFKQIQSILESRHPIDASTFLSSSDATPRHIFTRRTFVAGSAFTACAAAAGVIWQWDSLTNRVNDIFHPLPPKRFVALLNWPPTADIHIKPILTGVIDAIGSELARAEAFDRNLFVIAREVGPGTKTIAQLNELRDRWGANLVLAASGASDSKRFRISLRVLDPSSTRSIREKRISLPIGEQISFPTKAIRAAAELLDVSRYQQDDRRTNPDTQSSEAYSAFQEAETLMKQDNDTGLDAAIEKYKLAVEVDPRYATAYAKLALAYFRLYVLHGDPAALSLTRGNCGKALTLNPNSVEGHLALSSVLEYTGDKDGATQEIKRALSIDPVNPRTLVYEGQLYSRFNRWPEAEETFERVLELRPNNWLAHNELGIVFNLQGKYSKSMAEFRAASLAAPKSALALNNIGDVYLRLGKIREAEDAVAKSFALHPNDLAAITMAAALRSEGKPADAISFAEKAIALNPAQSAGWLELGDCYSLVRSHRGDAKRAYAKGAESQEEGLRTDPTSGPGWMLLALCRTKSGAPGIALDLIKRAEQSPADDIDSQLLKARTLELLGRRDEALATVAACLSRGATQFQIQSMPDMGPLRSDFRYAEILKPSVPPISAVPTH
jgi:serine/threonine protein kinase/Tfp pilus assembly protein PilF